MQWYLFTSDIDRYSRFHHISSLQLQAPSETVFGMVFWALFTPSQNVFGALGHSYSARADVAGVPRHHGWCLCTAEDVHESFRRRRRLAGRSRGAAAVQKILGDGMATISFLILDTLQKIISLLVSRYSHWYQKTKGLKCPCKIDLAICYNQITQGRTSSKSVNIKPSKCSMNPRIPVMFGIVSSLALLHYQQPH